MKNKVHGFNQQRANELGLTNNDLLVHRWLVDFALSGKMMTKIIDGQSYYWVNYDAVLADLPILGITKQTLRKARFGNLCKAGVLQRHHIRIKEQGSYSYYCFGENYESLQNPMAKKHPSTKVENHHSSDNQIPIIYPNTKSEHYNHAFGDSFDLNTINETKLIKACFSSFIRLYPKHENVKEAERVYNNTFKGLSRIDIITQASAILTGLQYATKNWQTKNTEFRYIPLPTTWLKNERWKDVLSVAPEESIEQKLGLGG